ncbi:MAG: transcription termination factor Rho, partial [Lentisphaerae bacterium]|nr:transcription termination factor Rho [Lentisphaerota bacterium]
MTDENKMEPAAPSGAGQPAPTGDRGRPDGAAAPRGGGPGDEGQASSKSERWNRFARNRGRRHHERRPERRQPGQDRPRNMPGAEGAPDRPEPPAEDDQQPRVQLPPLHLADLQKKELPEIHTMLEGLLNPEEIASLRKHELIVEFMRNYMRRGGTVHTNGVLEIISDGFGFLRSPRASYLPCPEDVYVAPSQVRRFGMRTGDFVEGVIRDPRERGERNERGKEKFFALSCVDTINGKPAAEARRCVPFENLTPLFPDRRLNLEVNPEEVAMRVMNIFTPIGMGQRGLIVAPPRTGKTVLLQKIANSISANHPDAHLIVLLIDERPEEVTDMQRTTKAQVL